MLPQEWKRRYDRANGQLYALEKQHRVVSNSTAFPWINQGDELRRLTGKIRGLRKTIGLMELNAATCGVNLIRGTGPVVQVSGQTQWTDGEKVYPHGR